MRKFALLILLTGWNTTNALQSVYIGKIGDHLDVIFGFNRRDTAFSHSYFYRKYGKDIEIELKQTQEKTTLTEYTPFPHRAPKALIEGQFKNDVFWGKYTNLETGKSLPIKLRPIQKTDLKSPSSNPFLEKIRTTDPYNYLKFDEPLVPGEWISSEDNPKKGKWINQVGKMGPYTYRYFTEPKSKVKYLRIDGKMFEKANQTLASKQFELAQDALACVGGDGNTGNWEYEANPTLISSHWISLNAQLFYFCGGPHPDAVLDGLTLTVKTGKRVSLREIFAFSEKQNPEAQAKAMIRFLEKTIPGFKDWECYENAFDGLTEPNWHLTSKGIVIQGSFSYALKSCEENSFELSYTQLKPFGNIDLGRF